MKGTSPFGYGNDALVGIAAVAQIGADLDQAIAHWDNVDRFKTAIAHLVELRRL